jgi:hypothetical protein
MRPYRALSLALATLVLVACNSGGKSGDDAAASPPPKLFETQRNALDKTKGVENTVQQQAQEQKQDTNRQTE